MLQNWSQADLDNDKSYTVAWQRHTFLQHMKELHLILFLWKVSSRHRIINVPSEQISLSELLPSTWFSAFKKKLMLLTGTKVVHIIISDLCNKDCPHFILYRHQYWNEFVLLQYLWHVASKQMNWETIDSAMCIHLHTWC